MFRIFQNSSEAIPDENTSQQSISQRGQYHGWKGACDGGHRLRRLFRANTRDLNRSGSSNELPGELVVDQVWRKCGYRLERGRLGQCSLMVEKATSTDDLKAVHTSLFPRYGSSRSTNSAYRVSCRRKREFHRRINHEVCKKLRGIKVPLIWKTIGARVD